MKFKIRRARITDISELEKLIEYSARAIQKIYFTHEQIQVALGTTWVVEDQLSLILDKTYWIVENSTNKIIASGGWSSHKSIEELDVARIYTFFVDPVYNWENTAKLILKECERDAAINGFEKIILETTINGSGFYIEEGYEFDKIDQRDLMTGLMNVVVKLQKSLNSI